MLCGTVVSLANVLLVTVNPELEPVEENSAGGFATLWLGTNGVPAFPPHPPNAKLSMTNPHARQSWNALFRMAIILSFGGILEQMRDVASGGCHQDTRELQRTQRAKWSKKT